MNKAVVFFTAEEINAIADGVIAEGFDKISGAKIKKLTANVKDFAEIVLFGRMVAEQKDLSEDAASSYNHAISIHTVEDNEIDFFTAVDDNNDVGSAHMNDQEFNSATYYRYVRLDLTAFAQQLSMLTEAERKDIVRIFIQAVLTAVPSGKQTGMASVPRPDYVLGVINDGQPVTLENAFRKPHNLKGTASSEKALKDFFDQQVKVWGLNILQVCEMPNVSLEIFCKDLATYAK